MGLSRTRSAVCSYVFSLYSLFPSSVPIRASAPRTPCHRNSQDKIRGTSLGIAAVIHPMIDSTLRFAAHGHGHSHDEPQVEAKPNKAEEEKKAEAENKATEKAAAEDRTEQKKLPGPLRKAPTGKTRGGAAADPNGDDLNGDGKLDLKELQARNRKIENRKEGSESKAETMMNTLRGELNWRRTTSERDTYLNMIKGRKGYNYPTALNNYNGDIKTESTPWGKDLLAECAKREKEVASKAEQAARLGSAGSGEDGLGGSSDGGIKCGPPCCDSLMTKRLFPNISPEWAKLRKEATAAWYDVRRKMSFKGPSKPPLPGM